MQKLSDKSIKKIGLFMITFNDVKDGVLYFSEVDAYEY